jgi:hypothetical protein
MELAACDGNGVVSLQGGICVTKSLKITTIIASLAILSCILLYRPYDVPYTDNPTISATASPSYENPPVRFHETTPDPQVLKKSAEYFEEGVRLLELKEYKQAKSCFLQVSEQDIEHYDKVMELLAVCLEGIKETSLEAARVSFDKAHYKECLSIIEQVLPDLPGDPDLVGLADQARHRLDNPVLYDGPVYHIFFHSLIVYPELCFTGDYMSEGYNKWMTTVSEFKAILDQLYDRGYVLIDIMDMFQQDGSGKVIRKEIYLPEGTKPLLLSVDNVSYEDYRSEDGFATRLVLDENQEVATLVRTPEGEEIVTRDGDVMPILDDFVKYHPDFSWNNAKGVLGLNGYQGILGYRTNSSSPNWEQEKTDAQPVVDALLSNGWRVANHSWSHSRSFSDMSITLDDLIQDTERWEDEVGSITGPTPIYITPFGIEFRPDDPRMRYLVSRGYYIVCSVGSRAYYHIFDGFVLMERINIDGYKMNYARNALAPLIDVDKVYDPARPPLK